MNKLKYILTFVISLIILTIIQLLVITIPNKAIEKNMLETTSYYKENPERHSILIDNKDFNVYLKDSLRIDEYADTMIFNILWNLNNKDKNIIERQFYMSYYNGNNFYETKNLVQTVEENKPANTSYYRYWHGSIIYIKPLLMLFNTQEIKVLNLILLTILSIYLLYLVFKKSKKLFFCLLLSLLSINLLTVAYCFEYYFAILIMLITSIITMKTLNKKNAYFYQLMIVSGTSICFFDFLTCETLTLTLPLLLRIIFTDQKIDKKNIKFIIKSILAWGLAYVCTYLVKWFMAIIIISPNQIFNIWSHIAIRSYKVPLFFQDQDINLFKHIPCLLFPFNLLNNSIILILLILILSIIAFIFFIKEKKKTLTLLLISSLGLIRLLILPSHTIGHYFFDYRALLPLIMIIILILIEGTLNIKKQSKTRGK